jgi:hypothetical protein
VIDSTQKCTQAQGLGWGDMIGGKIEPQAKFWNALKKCNKH